MQGTSDHSPGTHLQANKGHSHYVAFIKKELPGTDHKSWVLFNDEKVAKAADVQEMKKFAYIYFFRLEQN